MSRLANPTPSCVCPDCGLSPEKHLPLHPDGTPALIIPPEYSRDFSQIITLYNRLHVCLDGTYQPSPTILFLLRGPKRQPFFGREPYIQRHTRGLQALKRFTDLALSDLTHAEDALPIPDAAGVDSTGLGGHILPPNLACDNKTNITIVIEILYDLLRTEMGYYTRGMKIHFPPATADMEASWARCLGLLKLGDGVCAMMTRVEKLWVWTGLVTQQPLYHDWWGKLTARHTWRELLARTDKERENERFSVHWKALQYHPAAHLEGEPLRVQQQCKKPKDKSLTEGELDLLIDRVEKWKDGALGALPPSAQPMLKAGEWDDEVPTPVNMDGPQYMEDELEGRAYVGVFQDIMGFVLELVEVEDDGDGRWWEKAVASVWTPERKAALAGKVRRDWYHK